MGKAMRFWVYVNLSILTASFLLLAFVSPVHANKPVPEVKSREQIFAERRQLFDEISALTGIPWPYLAAIDQYERTIRTAKKRPPAKGLIDIYYSEEEWSGTLNPDREDTNPASISFFQGKGKDGNGDGLADRQDDLDLLFTMADYILSYGTNEQDFRIALWEYYHNNRSVERIQQFITLYSTYDRLDLFQHVFPVPLGSNYSYRGTWGARRGWGGYRIHEGTDIFAGYGVPARSTTYGVIEVRGWNPYGGWRIGIRDLNNIYHYYAHLSGFNKKLSIGDAVAPGDVLGWVGSSGYGKPGTSGKFPPHLHYGLYKDNGLNEWSFDPYPHLNKWEREERKNRLKK